MHEGIPRDEEEVLALGILLGRLLPARGAEVRGCVQPRECAGWLGGTVIPHFEGRGSVSAARSHLARRGQLRDPLLLPRRLRRRGGAAGHQRGKHVHIRLERVAAARPPRGVDLHNGGISAQRPTGYICRVLFVRGNICERVQQFTVGGAARESSSHLTLHRRITRSLDGPDADAAVAA